MTIYDFADHHPIISVILLAIVVAGITRAFGAVCMAVVAFFVLSDKNDES